jgi:Ca2+-binding EF-hand superfamily protein
MPHQYEQNMTFEEFLTYMRKEIGKKGSTAFWKWKFSLLSDKRKTAIKKELPYLSVHAVAYDYASKHYRK